LIYVARQIVEDYGRSLVLTGGKRDIEGCETIRKAVGSKAHNFAGKTTLRQLAALMEQAAFLISPDTGPAHIASAMKTPVIGLFATSPSKGTGPYFSTEFVIDKYDEALLRFGGVKDSEKRFGRIYQVGVMDLITKDEVLAKVEQVLTFQNA
jgi:heptosyltransferase I